MILKAKLKSLSDRDLKKKDKEFSKKDLSQDFISILGTAQNPKSEQRIFKSKGPISKIKKSFVQQILKSPKNLVSVKKKQLHRSFDPKKLENNISLVKKKPSQKYDKSDTTELFLSHKRVQDAGKKNKEIFQAKKIWNNSKSVNKTKINDEKKASLKGFEDISLMQKPQDNSPINESRVNQNSFGEQRFQVDQLLNQISSFVARKSFVQGELFNFSVSDKNLGNFNIEVQAQTDGPALNMKILANSLETAQFFSIHEGELKESLELAGVKLMDFKIMSLEKKGDSLNVFDDALDQKQEFEEHLSKRENLERDGKRRKKNWDDFLEHRRKEVA
jgi:hypothetical protein